MGAAIEIVFETHAWSEDNDNGVATGWRDGLARAVETATIAFGASTIPILHDWRLRECDYGERNGMPAVDVHANKQQFLDTPYPGGESWRSAVHRVGRFLDDPHPRWTGRRVLVIGHVATRWGLECMLVGAQLEDLVAADSHGKRDGSTAFLERPAGR